jgi:hypothetical protein
MTTPPENDARALKAAQELDMLITQRVSAGGVVSLPQAPGLDSGTEHGEGPGRHSRSLRRS